MKYLHILLLIISNSCFSQGLACEDLLETYASKLSKVEYIECTSGTGQTILEASYKVYAEDSEEIENILVQEYSMGKLKFGCCGWEPINGKNAYVENEDLKKINPNYIFEISMYANAEKKNENGKSEIALDRNKIDFNLKVKILDI